MTKNNHTSKEHYIPQVYLNGFASKDKRIYFYDLNIHRYSDQMVPVKSICYQKDLYEYKNKELHFDETQDTIRIRTNYKNPFEFRISYTGSNAPSILNKQNVLRQRGNNIYLSSVVEVKKDTPFSVYFEVNSPRSGSWLIFRNK